MKRSKVLPFGLGQVLVDSGAILLLAAPVFGTNEMFHIAEASRTSVGFVTNYDYYPRDQTFRTVQAAHLLEWARAKLAAERKISDADLLVNWGSTFPREPEPALSFEKDCVTDGGYWIGPCYRVTASTSATMRDLVAQVVAFQDASVAKTVTEPTLTSLVSKYRSSAVGYEPELQEFDPIWAPNSRYVAYTTVRKGNASLSLREISRGATRTLSPLADGLAASPEWSGDSHFLAYASLKEVVIYDVAKETSHRISLSPLFAAPSPAELLLHFEPGRLIFAGDTNGFSHYDEYAYDVEKDTMTLSTECPSGAIATQLGDFIDR